MGRPHGTEGAFAVREPTSRLELLDAGRSVLRRRVRDEGRLAQGHARSGRSLKLEGIDGRTAAEALRGQEIQVSRDEVGPLPDGEYLVDDLVGCEVVDGERPIGTVQEVLLLPAADVLEIAREEGGPLLIPLVADAVRSVDVARRANRREHCLRERRCRLTSSRCFRSGSAGSNPSATSATRCGLGHDLRFFNYRDTTPLPNGQVDDNPYGGGAGMLIRVDVVDAALQAVYGPDTGAMLEARRVAVLTPAGRQLDDGVAEELASLEHLTLLCGRYEGMDERVREHLSNDALSVGPYVLSGGELAAMVVADSVLRKLPGALGDEQSPVEESFSEALEGGVEYPHYTRPADYRGWEVPEVLLSGHHEQVRRWRSANISRPR